MPRLGLWVRLRTAPLFMRVFTLNAVVFLGAGIILGLSPATVSSPLLSAELVVLGIGLVVMLAMNALLLRVGLAPLNHLIGMMATIDLLRPGQRLPERRSGDLAPLVRSFNEMLERLESERAASNAQALSAQEGERRRIARELHDEVGQSLTVVLLELKRAADGAPRSLRPQLAQVQDTARASLADVRRIAQRLRPDVLEELGLSAALTTLTNEFASSTGIQVDRELGHLSSIPSELEVVIYRIAQEGLTNIARHAQAQTVELSVRIHAGREVRMHIRDDGRGFDGHEGGGIRGMRERALLIHAELQITAQPCRGTDLSLAIPLTPGQR